MQKFTEHLVSELPSGGERRPSPLGFYYLVWKESLHMRTPRTCALCDTQAQWSSEKCLCISVPWLLLTNTAILVP